MADINFYVWWIYNSCIHHHDPAFLVLAGNLGTGLGAAGLGLGTGYGLGNGLGAALGYPTGQLGGRGELLVCFQFIGRPLLQHIFTV